MQPVGGGPPTNTHADARCCSCFTAPLVGVQQAGEGAVPALDVLGAGAARHAQVGVQAQRVGVRPVQRHVHERVEEGAGSVRVEPGVEAAAEPAVEPGVELGEARPVGAAAERRVVVALPPVALLPVALPSASEGPCPSVAGGPMVS